jgi:hypothetical protein
MPPTFKLRPRASHAVFPNNTSHQVTSFITSHFRGGQSNSIDRLDTFGEDATGQYGRNFENNLVGIGHDRVPVLKDSPAPVAPVRVGAVATTLSFRNIALEDTSGKFTSARSTLADAFKLAGTNKLSEAALRVKQYSLTLNSEEKEEIKSIAIDVATKLAERYLKPEEADEFIRSLHVEWTSKGITLSLEGWEAASREIGWAPTPGGLDAGLGKYDGALRDMKPILLGGRDLRVIPLKLKGTQNAIESKIANTTLPGSGISFPGLAEASAAFYTSPGGKVPDVVGRTKYGERFTARVRKGQSIEDSIKYNKNVVYGVKRKFDTSKPGDHILSASGEEEITYSRSIVGGAVRALDKTRRGAENLQRAKSIRKKSDVTRGPDGTFIVFRTVVSPDYAASKAKLPDSYDSDWRKYRKRRRHHRTTNASMRSYNSQGKWFTAGRAPHKILEIVAEQMRGYVAGRLSQKVSRAFNDFRSLAQDEGSSFLYDIKNKLGSNAAASILSDLEGALSKIWTASSAKKK